MIHDLVPLHHRDWVTPRRLDALREVPRRGHVRHCLRELGVHSARRRRHARGRRDARASSRHRGSTPVLGRRRAGRSRRRYVLTVATLEPRKNLEVLVDAHACSTAVSARRRRRRGLGRAAGARRPGDRGSGRQPTTSWRVSTAARRSSPIRRASRASGSRSSRRWRAARPSSPRRTRRSTRPRATSRCAPIPTTRRRGRRRSCERASRRDELVPRGLEHASRFTWRAVGETMLEAWRRSRMKSRLSTSLRWSSTTRARRGTSRAVRAGLGP